MKLGRRGFLAAAAALAAAAVARLSLHLPIRGAPTDPIAAIVAREIPYLKLDAADLAQFARDFRAHAGRRVLELERSDPAEFAYQAASAFLLSTDFFANDADETKPVRYGSLHDPYLGCQSPFAEFA